MSFPDRPTPIPPSEAGKPVAIPTNLPAALPTVDTGKLGISPEPDARPASTPIVVARLGDSKPVTASNGETNPPLPPTNRSIPASEPPHRDEIHAQVPEPEEFRRIKNLGFRIPLVEETTYFETVNKVRPTPQDMPLDIVNPFSVLERLGAYPDMFSEDYIAVATESLKLKQPAMGLHFTQNEPISEGQRFSEDDLTYVSSVVFPALLGLHIDHAGQGYPGLLLADFVEKVTNENVERTKETLQRELDSAITFVEHREGIIDSVEQVFKDWMDDKAAGHIQSNIDGIIEFGSFARRDATYLSDIDVALTSRGEVTEAEIAEFKRYMNEKILAIAPSASGLSIWANDSFPLGDLRATMEEEGIEINEPEYSQKVFTADPAVRSQINLALNSDLAEYVSEYGPDRPERQTPGVPISESRARYAVVELILEQNPGITAKEIAEMIGAPRRTVTRDVQEIRETQGFPGREIRIQAEREALGRRIEDALEEDPTRNRRELARELRISPQYLSHIEQRLLRERAEIEQNENGGTIAAKSPDPRRPITARVPENGGNPPNEPPGSAGATGSSEPLTPSRGIQNLSPRQTSEIPSGQRAGRVAKAGDYEKRLNWSPFQDSELLRSITSFIESGRFKDGSQHLQAELARRGIHLTDERRVRATRRDAETGEEAMILRADFHREDPIVQINELTHRYMSLMLQRGGRRDDPQYLRQLHEMDIALAQTLRIRHRGQSRERRAEIQAYSTYFEEQARRRIRNLENPPTS